MSEMHCDHEDFVVALYKFARRQFVDELQADFPRLRSIKGARSLFVVDFVRSLGVSEQEVLMEACLRRAHPEASILLRDTLSQAHLEALRKFKSLSLDSGAQWRYIPIRAKRRYRDLFVAQGRSLPPEAVGADFMDGVPAELDRKVFFHELESHIDPNRWNKPRKCGASEWQLWAEGPNVTLNLDFGGSSDQLSYWHDVGGNAARFLSIGRWLGVGELAWDLCTVKDSVSVALVVAELVNEFLEHLQVEL